MKREVRTAAEFLTNLLRLGKILDASQLRLFHSQMEKFLTEHYQQHWFPNNAFKGSGYRCLRINHKMDPVIGKAGRSCGLREGSLRKLFPHELTMWVDPGEVSYRIGENGSICVLYDGNKQESLSDSDDTYDVEHQQKVLTDSDDSCGVESYHHDSGGYFDMPSHHSFIENIPRLLRGSCKETVSRVGRVGWESFIMDPRYSNLGLEHLTAFVSS